MHLRGRRIAPPGASRGFAAAVFLSLTIFLSLTLAAPSVRAAQPAAASSAASSAAPPAAPPASVPSPASSATSQSSPNVAPLSAPGTPPEPARSQQETIPGAINRGPGGQFTLRENAYEVRLNVTVLDSSGRSIQTLDQSDFRVFEDGVPQAITSFHHEDVPISLGILIDSSGSMYDKSAAVNAAALDLVKLSNPEDEAFLVDFSWEAFIDQDFTNNIAKLEQGLGYIKSSGGTAMYDALVASADYLSKSAKQPKQVLLIVTDGEDNASSTTLEAAIRRIQNLDGPVVYCIGLLFGPDDSRSESRHARTVLETIAAQTGGVAYFPKSVKDVDAIAHEVANDIRTQYAITYHSTKPPALGGYRVIRVEVKAKGYGKLSARTRSGYYPSISTSAQPSLTHAAGSQPAPAASPVP